MSAGRFQALMAGGGFSIPFSIGNTLTASGGRSSATLTTTAAIPAGSVAIVGIILVSNSAVSVSSVSDGTNSYSQAVVQTSGASVFQASIWYKLNATAVASGATITVTFSGASGGDECGISGTFVTGPTALDTHTGNTSASSTSVTVSSGTLASVPEIGFGVCDQQGSSSTYQNAAGFTNLYTSGVVSNEMMVFDYIPNIGNTASFNYIPTWTATPTSLTGCQATFK